MNFLDLLKTISARWYVLAAGMVVGGLLGWGATFILTPIYESDAVFYVSIDYTQTGALTDVEEDQAMRGVGDLIFSDEITTATLEQLKSEGIKLSKDEFYDDAIFEREEFRWAIRYRDADPALACQVVSAWANQADLLIQDSLQHARLAAAHQEVLTGLESCLQRTTQANSTADSCSIDNLDTILADIDEVSALITAEKEASRGLFSALSTELVDTAEVPVDPMRHQVGTLVFSGTMIGLLASLMILTIRFQTGHKRDND